MLDDIGVSNGLDWSPDGTTLYYTDSMRRLIWRFPFDMQSGTLGPREVFANVPQDQGCPDGLTVDAEGFVWSAHWNGWRVTRYDPDGRVERVLRLPVPRVTSLCFGGPDLDTLYMTSALIGLTSEQLLEAPLSGALFSCQPGVTGRPANYANVVRNLEQAERFAEMN
jgi:sugar lactone lactonase YvrE